MPKHNRGGGVRLAFCCCQPLASITFCLQEGDFSLPDPVWSAILLRKLRESGECRFGFVEQPKALRISRRRLLE